MMGVLVHLEVAPVDLLDAHVLLFKGGQRGDLVRNVEAQLKVHWIEKTADAQLLPHSEIVLGPLDE